ncbi:MAG: lipopolysaccharide biosynthesis protein [Candidatus Thorarchaeota archaeon]
MRFKQFIKENKGLLLITISNLLNIGFNLVFWFYGAFFLQKEYYGDISFVLSISYLATSISIFGFSFGILIYGAEDPSYKTLYNYNSIVFSLALIIGIITGIVQKHLWEYPLIILGQVSFLIIPCNMLAKQDYKEYFLWLTTCSCFKLILGVVGLYFNWNSLFVGILYTLPAHIMGKNFYFNSIKGFSMFKSSPIRRNLKEITLLGGININRNFISYLDKIVIGFWLGAITLGEYQFIFQIYLLLQFLPSTIQNYLIPNEINKTLKRSSIYLSIILSIILSVFAILSSNILLNWLFPKYANVIFVLYIISLSVPISTIASINVSRLMVKKKFFPLLLIYLVALLFQYTFIFLLVPILFLQGFGIALLLNQILIALLSLILLRKVD